jgi:rare lipoprotein A
LALAEEGMAVHCSNAFQGKPTANKEIFDQDGMTAAHKTLPFGTKVRVINLENNQSVVLTINDRMARRNRNIIDVTRRAARGLIIPASSGSNPR